MDVNKEVKFLLKIKKKVGGVQVGGGGGGGGLGGGGGWLGGSGWM